MYWDIVRETIWKGVKITMNIDNKEEYEKGIQDGIKKERDRIIKYLQDRYSNVGRNASRRAAYIVAKDLSIDLTLKEASDAGNKMPEVR